MKRFTTLFKQDLTVAVRNYFHLVVIALAVVMVVLINFVIPTEVKITPAELFYDSTEGKELENYLLEQGFEEERIYQSEEALKEAVSAESNSLGIMISGSLEEAEISIIKQGTESEEIINLLDATILTVLDHIRGETRETNHRVEYLRPQSRPIPFNKGLIPVIMLTEVVLLGFLLIAVMVFQEKEEGSVRAYRVSPGGTLVYILSKAAVNLILALLYAAIVILLTAGAAAGYWRLLLIITLSNLLMTLLGLAVSVFFRNLQEFLFVGIGIIIAAGLPTVSYLTPSFTPDWITWIPSYQVLFGLREVLFPTGKTAYLSSINLVLLGEMLLMLGLSYWAVRKKLMREGR